MQKISIPVVDFVGSGNFWTMEELRAFSPFQDDQAKKHARKSLEQFLNQEETIEFVSPRTHRRFATPPRITSAELMRKHHDAQSPFDPYRKTSQHQQQTPHHYRNSLKNTPQVTMSLLDQEDGETEDDQSTIELPITSSSSNRTNNIPGASGFLEMEDDPTITTKSGLLLTHRKANPGVSSSSSGFGSSTRHAQPDERKHHSPVWKSPRYYLYNLDYWLQYTRLGLLLFAVFLFLGTLILLHHSWNNGAVTTTDKATIVEETIVLLPLPDDSANRRRLRETPEELPQQTILLPFNQTTKSSYHHKLQLPLHPLEDLRELFENWVAHHGKSYPHPAEKERRFEIWKSNHDRTHHKNNRHGPCELTGKTVFGSNHLQDLSPEEFQSQYLNAYQAPRPHTQPHDRYPVLHPDVVPPPERSLLRTTSSSPRLLWFGRCKWYDVSCCLRYIFSHYLYGLGGTMEPAFDSNNYPSAVDWRDSGAVTQVHSQGNCGACWAITAVETIESAYFLGTGNLYDLSETEVIVCEEDCEMCSGGWPQYAFEYAMKHGGLPLESDMSYDADYLLSITEAVVGDSDAMNADTVKSFQAQTCPSDNHSGDSKDNNNNYGSGNGFARYGAIKGYGFSTEKCVCYTDGTGCNCDEQNESYAVRNMATYGPAVVCLDASTWQDYTEGIITASSGCSQGFMDVNHCVQAVGYAFTSDDDNTEGNDGSHSGSGSNSRSGSRDNSKRTGYWIVRNQWSEYWGMQGYAYVAMGGNTCGILNDMMQAYM